MSAEWLDHFEWFKNIDLEDSILADGLLQVVEAARTRVHDETGLIALDLMEYQLKALPYCTPFWLTNVSLDRGNASNGELVTIEVSGDRLSVSLTTCSYDPDIGGDHNHRLLYDLEIGCREPAEDLDELLEMLLFRAKSDSFEVSAHYELLSPECWKPISAYRPWREAMELQQEWDDEFSEAEPDQFTQTIDTLKSLIDEKLRWVKQSAEKAAPMGQSQRLRASADAMELCDSMLQHVECLVSDWQDIQFMEPAVAGQMSLFD